MPDEMLIARAVGFAGLALSVLLVALFVVALVERVRGRSVGRGWGRALAFAVGGQIGYTMLAMGSLPLLAVPPLVVAGAVAVWLARTRRRAAAGWFTLGVALPWALLWGAYVALLVGGAPFNVGTTVARFLVGAVPALVAVGVIARGDPPPPAPRPDAPLGQPGSRRIGNIAPAIRAAMSLGPFSTMEAAGMATLVALTAVVSSLPLPLPPLVEAALLVVGGTLLATEVALRAAPRRVVGALEAFAWLGEWELERARGIGVKRPISTEAEARAWLATVPERRDDRWLRWELLLLVGRLDDARDVALRMPEDSPTDRFERAFALDRIEWARGEDGDPDSVRAAAAAIGPPTADDRLRAEVALALRASQRLAADGADPQDVIEPLVAVRQQLGSRPDVRIGPLFVRRTRVTIASFALVVVGLPYLLDPVSDLIVDLVA